ncbi:MAG: CPBP family intramembrane metalloprotease [Candidatus Methanoperedens sp.]|nr:CPBP family intramembrane metalloprotease [Candidatus Methanoperedens sp.]MCE8428513.1 CPBP family intramembrane metalloprotease [Candidatus Methanoperedens sp.]
MLLKKDFLETPKKGNIEIENGKFIHYDNYKEPQKIITGSKKFEIKKEIFLPMLAIAAGEILMFFGMIYYSLVIHIINLQAITLAPFFKNYSSKIKMIHQSLILLLLMRIVNLAMPYFFSVKMLWYPLTYGIMYIAVFSVIKKQQISYKELGFIFKRFYIYLPSAILIGAVSAIIEYRILKPLPLIDDIGLSNLVLIAVVMFLFVGAIEELIFRSILLTRLEKVLEPRTALLISAILFGIMHSGYGRIDEILFAGIFGIVIGYIFQKTRSFPFIIVIHGTANILLFGILPIIWP